MMFATWSVLLVGRMPAEVEERANERRRVVGPADRRQLRLRALAHRAVGDAAERQAPHRGGHERDADAGGDQADDRLHLRRLLDHPRQAAGGGQRADQLVVEAGRLLAREQHERLPCQPLQGDAAQAGQRVAVRQRREQRLAQERLDPHALHIDGRADEPQVEGAGRQRAQLLNGRALAQLQLDVGPRGPEALHDVGDDREQRRADEADAKAADLAFADPPSRGDRAVELGQDRAGVAQERRAGRGELNAPARPLQQEHAQLVLEPAQLLAQRGLGQMQPRGRAAEVQLLRDRDEVLQLAQLHGSSPPNRRAGCRRRPLISIRNHSRGKSYWTRSGCGP
jgi:hypothetical protein